MRTCLLLLLLVSCGAPVVNRSTSPAQAAIPVSLQPYDGYEAIPGGWLYRIPDAWQIQSCNVDTAEWLGLPDYDTGRWNWQVAASRQWEPEHFVRGKPGIPHTYLARVSTQRPCTLWYATSEPLLYMTANGNLRVGKQVNITFSAQHMSGADSYWWFVIDGPAQPTGNVYMIPANNIYSAAGLDPYWGELPLRSLLAVEAAQNASGRQYLDTGYDPLRGAITPPGPVTIWSAGVWTAQTGALVDASGPLCSRSFTFSQPGQYRIWFDGSNLHDLAVFDLEGDRVPLTAGPPLLIEIRGAS